MGPFGILARAALGLGAGGLGILTSRKLRDDRHLDAMWQALLAQEGDGGVFGEDMVAGLPDVARRYFLHAIRPGTPLASRLHWHYTGSIRTGEGAPWLDLSAEQVVAKGRGFVWRARVTKGPLIITGDDYYLDGAARMKIAILGLLPVVNAGGPEIAKSALGRLLIEGFALPTALLPGPNVAIEAVDDSRFTAIVSLHGERTPLTITVDEAGRVRDLSMPRWGNVTEDRSFRFIPYGAAASEEQTFDGYTIPSELKVGWWYGTERYLEVIRLRVDWARFS